MSEQERFDKLLERMQTRTSEEFVGVRSRTLQMGQVAVRFSVFNPSEGPTRGYNPSIQLQDLVEGQSHNGLYWSPVSEIYLRRDKLARDGTEDMLSELETKLDLFEKILDFDSEIAR